MPSQVKFGKGFEYACLIYLYRELSVEQQVDVIMDASFHKTRQSFEELDNKNQIEMLNAAQAAARVLIRLEPNLIASQENSPLYLSIQPDNRGRVGDVRDVLAMRRQNDWEVGISAKHNHDAVKHSRLSFTIDFGLEWFGIPCSQNYFQTIRPLFEELKELTTSGQLWRNINNKSERFYIPLLKAFLKELRQLDENNPGIVPMRLLSYLLGRNDFYKVIANRSTQTTTIQAFSLYGTLNRAAGKIQPQTKIPKLKLPNRFYNLDFKPGNANTIIIACDEGWTITARIHNASSYVEPSLKFDIKLGGNPPSLYTHHEPWN